MSVRFGDRFSVNYTIVSRMKQPKFYLIHIKLAPRALIAIYIQRVFRENYPLICRYDTKNFFHVSRETTYSDMQGKR